MSRNALYLVIGALIVVVAVFAFYTYQEESQTGIEVQVDDNGISVEGN